MLQLHLIGKNKRYKYFIFYIEHNNVILNFEKTQERISCIFDTKTKKLKTYFQSITGNIEKLMDFENIDGKSIKSKLSLQIPFMKKIILANMTDLLLFNSINLHSGENSNNFNTHNNQSIEKISTNVGDNQLDNSIVIGTTNQDVINVFKESAAKADIAENKIISYAEYKNDKKNIKTVLKEGMKNTENKQQLINFLTTMGVHERIHGYGGNESDTTASQIAGEHLDVNNDFVKLLGEQQKTKEKIMVQNVQNNFLKILPNDTEEIKNMKKVSSEGLEKSVTQMNTQSLVKIFQNDRINIKNNFISNNEYIDVFQQNDEKNYAGVGYIHNIVKILHDKGFESKKIMNFITTLNERGLIQEEMFLSKMDMNSMSIIGNSLSDGTLHNVLKEKNPEFHYSFDKLILSYTYKNLLNMEQDNVKNGDFKKVNDFKEYGEKLLKNHEFNKYTNGERPFTINKIKLLNFIMIMLKIIVRN